MTPQFHYGPGDRVTLVFAASEIDGQARSSAEAWLKDHGFSVGTMQGSEPREIMFRKNMPIGKWRTLVPLEREILHGVMTGDVHGGPVTITIFDSAPLAAREAIVAVPQVEPAKMRSGSLLTDTTAILAVAICLAAIGLASYGPISRAMQHHAARKYEMRVAPFGLRAAARDAGVLAEGRR